MPERSSLLISAAAAALLLAAPGSIAAETPWQTYADCAAGYLANWQDRLADPSRSKQMANTIRAQSQDYEMAAVRRYAAQKLTDEAQAAEAVRAYVKANLARFVAMDNNGQLNHFLDSCPQPDASDRP